MKYFLKIYSHSIPLIIEIFVTNFLAQSISMNAIMQVCLFKETGAFGTLIFFVTF